MEPDGRLIVYLNDEDRRVFYFKDTTGFRQERAGLKIMNYKGEGYERDITIPWHKIDRMENFHNSSAYRNWLQDQPERPDKSEVNNCLTCGSKLTHHQIKMIFIGHRSQEILGDMGLS
jgi:hypothetical protein